MFSNQSNHKGIKMSDPVTEVAASPITIELLFSVIGGLIIFIISALGWIFKREIAGLWKHVNEHRSDIKNNSTDISKMKTDMKEVSVKIDNLGKGQDKITWDMAQNKIEREQRDKELFEKIDESNKTSLSQFKEIQKMIYDHLIENKGN